MPFCRRLTEQHFVSSFTKCFAVCQNYCRLRCCLPLPAVSRLLDRVFPMEQEIKLQLDVQTLVFGDNIKDLDIHISKKNRPPITTLRSLRLFVATSAPCHVAMSSGS